MSHPLTDAHQGKPTVTVSIPPDKREAFYRALLALRQISGNPFSSMSSLIVETVMQAGEEALSRPPTDHPQSSS